MAAVLEARRLQVSRIAPWVLMGLVAATAIVAALVLYKADNSVFLYFGDGVSHLTLSRLIIDSRTPGILNIGTVWLPLPHVLYLPFSLIDSLFFSGIAGPVVGIPLLTGTTLLLYSLIKRLTRSVRAAFVCALVFGVNPNIVYMALTPMTELMLLFFVTLAAWMLLAWIDTEHDAYLFSCAAAVVCASLCRYEAWVCVPFVSIVALVAFVERTRRGLPWRERWAVIASGLFVWYGIAFWLLWNRIVYGDMLEFIHWVQVITSGTVSASGHRPLWAGIHLIGTAIRFVYGPVLLATGAISLARLWRRGMDLRVLMVLIFTSLPAVFMLGAILGGEALVDQWRWNWRFLLTLAPFLSVAAALGIQELFYFVRSDLAFTVVTLGMLAIPVIQVTMPEHVGVSTYIDARKGFNAETRSSKRAGEVLSGANVSGSVALVTGFGQAQRIMIASGLPTKSFHFITSLDDEDMFRPLWPEDNYVILAKSTHPESERFVDYWLARRSLLLERYTIMYEDKYYLIFRLIPARTSYREQDHARR